VLSLTILAGAWARSKSYEAVFTPFELRRMTNDPATNPTLAKFAEKLDDPAAEAEKIIKLADFVSWSCIGVRQNSNVLRKYRADRLTGLKPDELEEAEFKTHRMFFELDYVDEAELCAGISYLFGRKGALLPNAVTLGTGEMDLDPFLRANPGHILSNPLVK
jgi:hypothetical protein